MVTVWFWNPASTWRLSRCTSAKVFGLSQFQFDCPSRLKQPARPTTPITTTTTNQLTTHDRSTGTTETLDQNEDDTKDEDEQDDDTPPILSQLIHC